MKKLTQAALALVILAAFNVSAEIESVSELRIKASYLTGQIELLANQCDQRVDNANRFKFGLNDIKTQVVVILNDQKQQGKIVNAQRLLELIELAQNILPGFENDCLNGTSYSKILLEMYMTNIDTELMILQYGVDSIGYRN